MTQKAIAELTEPERQAFFRELFSRIEAVLPAGPSSGGRLLFSLVVWEQGEAHFISNARAEDVGKGLRAASEDLRKAADRLDRRRSKPPGEQT